MIDRAIATMVLMAALSGAGAIAAEFGTDRPGLDYRNFDLSRPDHGLCEQACAADRKCRAWTYVRPGIRGTSAHCRLKFAVPKASRSGCCVSGQSEAKPVLNITGEVQRLLAALGYDPGPADGRLGSRTRDAIMRFQADHRLPLHGQISSGLITVLTVALRERQAKAARRTGPGSPPPAAVTPAGSSPEPGNGPEGQDTPD